MALFRMSWVKVHNTMTNVQLDKKRANLFFFDLLLLLEACSMCVCVKKICTDVGMRKTWRKKDK